MFKFERTHKDGTSYVIEWDVFGLIVFGSVASLILTAAADILTAVFS